MNLTPIFNNIFAFSSYRLLELLKELHGPADIRQQYIMDVIKEANRFKRNHMAQIIQQNMPNLVSIDS